MFAFEGRFAAAVSIVSGSSRLRPMKDLGIGPEYQGFMSPDAAIDNQHRRCEQILTRTGGQTIHEAIGCGKVSAM